MKATLEFKIDSNTERIKILEEKVDKHTKKLIETEIDVVEIKKDMNLMNGDIKILIDNESKISEGLIKIEKKLPKHFWQRLKVWHYIVLIIVILFIMGGING